MINEWKHGLAGELRVGVGPMLAATLMGEFFAELMNEPPGYSLKLHSETAARVTKRLKDEELDVAIILFELNVAEEGLVRELLFQDRLAVFVGEDDPLARSSSRSTRRRWPPSGRSPWARPPASLTRPARTPD